MEKAYLFGILFVVFFLLFVYQLDLILFFYREKKRFFKQKTKGEYRAHLERKQKKTKHPYKRNVYLSFLILQLQEEGKNKEAEALIPFLKNDFLLGIRKK